MKSPSLGVAGTLLASFFIFTNSATATNVVNFSDIRGTLSGTTAGLNFSGSTLFAGTFSGPVTWTSITLANRTQNYSVTGVSMGSIAGKIVDAAALSTVNTVKEFFQKSALIEEEELTFAGANGTSVSSIPEPSTFNMLLTGVGTLAIVRYKVFTRRKRN